MQNNQLEKTFDTQKPLVSFALFAYNQEDVIREAIEGALAQTYEPLEIIFSDDCSSDRTFEIMQVMASEYEGPHNIKLNRNIKNMGISRHVRYIHEISKGSIIIHAAGDDISCPERTEKIVNAFLKEENKPSLVMSNSEIIDANGNGLGLFSTPSKKIRDECQNPLDFSSIGGAPTYAIDRKLVDIFPVPLDGIFGEDRLLLFRARLTDGILYIPDVLVKYRISQKGVWSSTFLGGLSNREVVDRHARRVDDYILIFKQMSSDVLLVKGVDAHEVLIAISKQVQIRLNWVSILRGNFFQSLKGIFIEAKEGRPFFDIFKIFLIRWLPILRTAKIALHNKTERSRLRSGKHPGIQAK